MAAAFRAQATAGNGQASATSSLSLTVPSSAQVGDDAVISVFGLPYNDTLTVPSGWTLLSGPDQVGQGAVAWLLRKTLAAGDPGATITLTVSASSRMQAVLVVGSGTTPTGLQFRSVTDTTATGVPKLPTLSNVPAGSFVVGLWNRRVSNASPVNVGVASGFTAGTLTSSSFTSNGPNVASRAGYQVASAAGSYGGSAGSSSPMSTGVNYLIAFPPAGGSSAVSVAGATASVTASAGAGTPTTGVIVYGATAAATASASAGSPVKVLSSVTSSVWPPDPYRAMIRSGGYSLTYTADATRGGLPVAGAVGLSPVGGTVSDTIKPGVRRTLNLNLAPEPGLYDLLAQTGTRLTVTGHVRYPNRQVQDVPMGVFVVDQPQLVEGGGALTVTAADKWSLIQRAKFASPHASTPGMLVTAQIAALIQGALGATESVTITSQSTATMGWAVWDSDRAQAIIDIATGAGLWVYFDRYGTATVADIPAASPSAAWLVDASPTGVLLSLTRQKSHTATYNVVAVDSGSSGTSSFPTQIVWDSDPNSPTYAGTDPINHPEFAGPFGVSVYRYPTTLPLTTAEASQTAGAILSTTVGLASQVTLTQAHNPAVDAFDAIDVLSPFVRYDIPRALERHVVDTVTHSLDLSQPQQITGRSTRTDAYT